LPILFQKSIGNGIANTFVPKILPIIFGNTFTFLDAMVIVHCSAFTKYYFTPSIGIAIANSFLTKYLYYYWQYFMKVLLTTLSST